MGFEDFALEDESEPREGKTDEDAVPEDAPAIAKRGQIWQLGAHRVMCGDSTSESDVARLMNGEKADTVFTDPPYNINFKPQRGTHDGIENDNMEPEVFKSWLSKAIFLMNKCLSDDTYAFVWSGWSTIDQFFPVIRKSFEVKAMPIWVKNNFGIGYYSRPKYEPFFLCLKGKPDKPKPAPSDVWEHSKVHKTIHSCEKPVGLICDILDAYGCFGICLDLFLGSGSTLIACEKTGRTCYGMEIDPKYCDVIIKRWEDYTGQKAELLEAE